MFPVLLCTLLYTWADCKWWLHWRIIASLNIVSEILLAGTALTLVASLQVALPRKLGLVFLFSPRLLLIAPIVCHLHYCSQGIRSTNPSLAATAFVICKQVEIASAIVAANIPTLRPFTRATATHYGAPGDGPRTLVPGDKVPTRSAGFPRRTTTSQRSRSQLHDVVPLGQSQIENSGTESTAAGLNTNTRITTGKSQDSISRASDDSERMIIKKDVQYAVVWDES